MESHRAGAWGVKGVSIPPGSRIPLAVGLPAVLLVVGPVVVVRAGFGRGFQAVWKGYWWSTYPVGP